MMQVEIDDLDQTPAMAPYDADEAMVDSDTLQANAPSDIERMQALIMQ